MKNLETELGNIAHDANIPQHADASHFETPEEQLAYFKAYSDAQRFGRLLGDRMLSNILVAENLELEQKNKELESTLQSSRKNQDRLEHNATLDPLTGLQSKRDFENVLDGLVDMRERGEDIGNVGIISIDLINFKRVNDEKGHDVGDEVIKRVAELLAKNLRTEDRRGENEETENPLTEDRRGEDRRGDEPSHDSDLVAVSLRKREEGLVKGTDPHLSGRIGGDEFAVLCDLTPPEGSDLTPQDILKMITARVRKAFNDELALPQHEDLRDLRFGYAIGGAVLEHEMSAKDVSIAADLAMYVDKKSQKTYIFSEEELGFIAAHREMLQQILTTAGYRADMFDVDPMDLDPGSDLDKAV
ncbi:MAG: diguanylate cyclase [Candidatus Saccharibacteria bacterium]|nr:diguanylate cyclase [Candidatus Saccharibacteria bacterium]